MNSTTPAYDAAKLNADQLDGQACIECGSTTNPMKPVGAHNGVQQFACRSHGIEPLPEAWALKAARDADTARSKVQYEYQALMAALSKERDARDNGTASDPSWLAVDPCPSWCTMGVDHDASTHPADRGHFGVSHAVEMVTMPPVTAFGGFVQPQLNLSLDQWYREKEPRICLFEGDTDAAYLTLGEAEQLAQHLVAMIRQARGLWAPVSSVFDSEGRCPDLMCRHCRPQPEQKSA